MISNQSNFASLGIELRDNIKKNDFSDLPCGKTPEETISYMFNKKLDSEFYPQYDFLYEKLKSIHDGKIMLPKAKMLKLYADKFYRDGLLWHSFKIQKDDVKKILTNISEHFDYYLTNYYGDMSYIMCIGFVFDSKTSVWKQSQWLINYKNELTIIDSEYEEGYPRLYYGMILDFKTIKKYLPQSNQGFKCDDKFYSVSLPLEYMVYRPFIKNIPSDVLKTDELEYLSNAINPVFDGEYKIESFFLDTLNKYEKYIPRFKSVMNAKADDSFFTSDIEDFHIFPVLLEWKTKKNVFRFTEASPERFDSIIETTKANQDKIDVNNINMIGKKCFYVDVNKFSIKGLINKINNEKNIPVDFCGFYFMSSEINKTIYFKIIWITNSEISLPIFIKGKRNKNYITVDKLYSVSNNVASEDLVNLAFGILTHIAERGFSKSNASYNDSKVSLWDVY